MGFDTSYIVNKQLPVDMRGDISESIERASLIGLNLKTEYYREGVEEKVFVEGFNSNNGSVLKATDMISLKVEGNPTTSAVKTIVSNGSVDLTDVNWLELDFEMTGTTGYNTNAYFVVGTSKTASYTDYVLRQAMSVVSGVPLARNTVKLNVSQLTGLHYIRVHLTDASTTIDVAAELKIYGVYATVKSKNSPSLQAFDTTGKLVKLTAELDDAGKAVLRVIDAAPVAYDPVKDVNRVLSLPKKRKMQMVIPLSNMQIGNTDININSAAGTLGKVISIVFSVNGVAAPATAGTHAIEIYDRSVSATNLIYSLSGAYWENLVLYRTHKQSGVELPNVTFEELHKIIAEGFYFGDNSSIENPLILRYKNNSDVVRSNTSYITINYLEETII